MVKQDIIKMLNDIYTGTEGNVLTQKMTDVKSLIGLRMFDEPILGIADAEDELFETYKQPGVVGPQMLSPKEWLTGAKSVISFFMPFSEEVKKSNAVQTDKAALEWLYARIEGQSFLRECSVILADKLRENGCEVCVPSTDARFAVDVSIFSSNWSERHAAYAAGLGTFGKSRGLITAKGMAGRLGSLIISEKIEADPRPYSEVYEYCIDCGACTRRCPVNAIPAEGIKIQTICAPFVDQSKIEFAPRYGCGLCQTGVPCESGIPQK